MKNRETGLCATRRSSAKPGDTLRPPAAHPWIRVVACLVLILGGLGSLVACGGKSPTDESGSGAVETLPAPATSHDDGVPQTTPVDSNIPGAPGARDYWPTEEWRMSTPEEQGMDSAILQRMVSEIDDNDINIDSVLVIRHGYLVLEEYRNHYGPKAKHHVQSVTKSFSSMLIGIAIHEGLIPGVEQRMVDLFPDHIIQNLDARKESITLENLLTMSDGMDWHELDYPYDDRRNTLGQMWTSRDAVQHILDRPMARDPGESWAYNSGTSILLGGILEQVTKRDVLDFAYDYLFRPIGITGVRWTKTTGEHYHTDGGLWMTPRDMARFGYLMLNMGTWDGREIVSPQWVEQSTTAHYQTPWGYGYGYQWWLLPDVQAYAATGHYEQKIYVVPRADLVVVFTAYIADEDPHPTDAFLARYIVPACTDLPELKLVETYDKYGFALEYPRGAQLIEVPIPGRDTISDESGIVQFNSLYPPLEVVSILWDRAADDVDLRENLEEVKSWLGNQPGIQYEWGEFSPASLGDHDLLLQFFHTTAEGMPFSGVVGIWHCEQAGRIYMLTYAVTPETETEDVLDAFHQHLDGLSCHGVD